MPQLICEKLTLGYEGKIVCTEVSFQVNEGDYLCIVGENGSGKSTLVKAISGLVKLMGGKVTYGQGLTSKEIGYLPQHTEIQRDFPASVIEIVMSGFLGQMGILPFYSKEQKTRATAIMDKLGISQIRNKCYRDLSGGQQQRVLLARALCATSKMLVLDEPVSGLDPLATEDMYNLLKMINEEDKITILMVSHDVTTALSYATHVLHMGKTMEFFGEKNDYIKAHFLAKNRF